MIRCNSLSCYHNDGSHYCYDANIEDGYCTMRELDPGKCEHCGAKLILKLPNRLEHFGTSCAEEWLVCPWGCE